MRKYSKFQFCIKANLHSSHAVLARGPASSRGFIQGENDSLATGTKEISKKIYVLSGNDKETVRKQMNDLTVYLEQRPEVFQNSLLPNLAYTLGQRRSHLTYKIAIPARASSELIPLLAGSEIVPSRSPKEPRIGFVFTGQGAQWHAMGKELLDAYPVFAASMERFDMTLGDLGADFSIIGKHDCKMGSIC